MQTGASNLSWAGMQYSRGTTVSESSGGSRGEPRVGRRGARNATPVVVTLILLLAGLIHLTSAPLMTNFEPMFYRLTAAISFSKSDYVVYLSENTAAHFRAVGGDYETLVSPWKQYFTARKKHVEYIKDLKDLGKRSQATLILPSAVSLNASERAAILAFYNRGGSILATWATGSWSAPGKWAGWDFLKSLGTEVLGDTATKAGTFLLIRGETPVSVGIDAGERVSLSPSPENALLFRGDDSSAARLVNWLRLAEPELQGKNSVVQFKEASSRQGRVVLFGFSENAWANTAANIYPLLDNSLSWLMRHPAIVRATWPNARPAAQIIEMDTEEGFSTAEDLAALAKAKSIPVSYFMLTSVARQHPETLRRLAQNHDIGFHGDVHDGFKGQPSAVQFKRIRSMQTDLESILGADPARVGFRPPREEYDKTTELLLQENGIQYEVIDPDSTNGRIPFIAKSNYTDPARSLIALPRTQRDDLNLLEKTKDPAALEKEMIADLDVLIESGGLGVLSIHSQNFAPGSALAMAMPFFLNYLNTMRGKVWLASASDTAHWWRERERVTLRTVTRGEVVELNMTVSDGNPVEGLELIVMTPERNAAPKISALKVGMPTPTVEALDPLRYRISFPGLSSRSYSYQITF